VIEALAAGLPVAAVASPGVDDAVQSGCTGYLTSKPEGLAAAIVGLVANRQRLQQMSAAAREASKHFDIDETVAHTLRLYEELRATRPDLKRDKVHGRWSRPQRQRLLEQLVRLLRPAE
jgi:glycosyltransferase involved in cell wall biosynthesis